MSFLVLQPQASARTRGNLAELYRIPAFAIVLSYVAGPVMKGAAAMASG
jgi:hypothetical protein